MKKNIFVQLKNILNATNDKIIDEAIAADIWSIVHGERCEMPFVLRYRSNIPKKVNSEKYSHCIMLCWTYGNEDTGDMPTEDDSKLMGIIENLLIECAGDGMHSTLVAILTFDGARQWVIYGNKPVEFFKIFNEKAASKPGIGILPELYETSSKPDARWKYFWSIAIEVEG